MDTAIFNDLKRALIYLKSEMNGSINKKMTPDQIKRVDETVASLWDKFLVSEATWSSILAKNAPTVWKHLCDNANTNGMSVNSAQILEKAEEMRNDVLEELYNLTKYEKSYIDSLDVFYSEREKAIVEEAKAALTENFEKNIFSIKDMEKVNTKIDLEKKNHEQLKRLINASNIKNYSEREINFNPPLEGVPLNIYEDYLKKKLPILKKIDKLDYEIAAIQARVIKSNVEKNDMFAYFAFDNLKNKTVDDLKGEIGRIINENKIILKVLEDKIECSDDIRQIRTLKYDIDDINATITRLEDGIYYMEQIDKRMNLVENPQAVNGVYFLASVFLTIIIATLATPFVLVGSAIVTPAICIINILQSVDPKDTRETSSEIVDMVSYGVYVAIIGIALGALISPILGLSAVATGTAHSIKRQYNPEYQNKVEILHAISCLELIINHADHTNPFVLTNSYFNLINEHLFPAGTLKSDDNINAILYDLKELFRLRLENCQNALKLATASSNENKKESVKVLNDMIEGLSTDFNKMNSALEKGNKAELMQLIKEIKSRHEAFTNQMLSDKEIAPQPEKAIKILAYEFLRQQNNFERETELINDMQTRIDKISMPKI